MLARLDRASASFFGLTVRLALYAASYVDKTVLWLCPGKNKNNSGGASQLFLLLLLLLLSLLLLSPPLLLLLLLDVVNSH